MKYSSILVVGVFLLVASVPAAEQASDEGAGQQVRGDDPIGFIVEAVERSDTLPDDVPPRVNVPPQHGNDYVTVVIVIARADNAHLIGPVDCRLVDSEGNDHDKALSKFDGGTLKDRTDINSGLTFGKGASFTLFYQLPKRLDPVRMSVHYEYATSMDDETAMKGHVAIDIANH